MKEEPSVRTLGVVSKLHGIFAALTRDALAAEQKPIEQLKPSESSKGQVAVDVYEQDGYFIIRAPIAGVEIADIDIDIVDNTVIIKGHREKDENSPDTFMIQECFFGEFERKIHLPFTIDAKRVRASFSKKSILKIIIPKDQEKVKIVRISEQ